MLHPSGTKSIYVRNHFNCPARPDASRRAANLGAQPLMGIRTQWWIRGGFAGARDTCSHGALIEALLDGLLIGWEWIGRKVCCPTFVADVSRRRSYEALIRPRAARRDKCQAPGHFSTPISGLQGILTAVLCQFAGSEEETLLLIPG